LFEAQAPGSVMLMGEHAVLHGYPAIVALLRMTEKTQHKKFNYVLTAIQQFHDIIPSGFDLQIVADFSDQLGLGSSAAVTVAVLAVLQKWISQRIDLDKIYKLGVKVIRAVQHDLGSGADVAASVYGGVIVYQTKPLKIETINVMPKITLIYTGYKTPTVEVIDKVNNAAKNAPDYFNNLYRIIGDLVLKGIKCFKQQDWQQLGQLFYSHFDAQRALGVSDDTIETIVAELKNMPAVYGAKISGAGLGDCVIALGRADNTVKVIDVKVDENGVI
jgi:mevalonate kinase